MDCINFHEMLTNSDNLHELNLHRLVPDSEIKKLLACIFTLLSSLVNPAIFSFIYTVLLVLLFASFTVIS